MAKLSEEKAKALEQRKMADEEMTRDLLMDAGLPRVCTRRACRRKKLCVASDAPCVRLQRGVFIARTPRNKSTRSFARQIARKLEKRTRSRAVPRGARPTETSGAPAR